MVREIIFASLLFVTITSFAEEAIDALKKQLTQFSTIQGNFEQLIHDNYGELLQHSTGKMAVERPQHFRWYTDEPTEQLIISNGTKLWVYDIDLEQVTVEKFQSTYGSLPALLLTGEVAQLEQRFEVDYQKKGALDVYRLTPKQISNEEMFQWVELSFYHSKIKQMHLLDNLEQHTELRFSNVHLNQHVSAEQFNFNPPAGVDVIVKD